YTGCVSGVQLVKRPWLPADAKNGTGEELITDGRIAVLALNDCQHPIEDAAGLENLSIRTRGNHLDRTTRQTVLTLKNNIVRDNVVARANSGTRYSLDSKKRKETAPERQMNVDGELYTLDTGYGRHRDDYTHLSTRSQSKTSKPATAASWVPPSVE